MVITEKGKELNKGLLFVLEAATGARLYNCTPLRNRISEEKLNRRQVLA